MATLHESHAVDLEAVDSTTVADNGGGGGGATTTEGGSSLPSTATNDNNNNSSSTPRQIEIVSISENNTSNKDKKDKRRESNVSECSVEVLDLENGNLHSDLAKMERDCRICHMSLDAESHENGVPIELGCSCKDDLAGAHKQCAEAWFKIKGNKTCEICGSIARNVVGINEAELVEQLNNVHDAAVTATASQSLSEARRRFWQGHRFLNFLLACMVFAFVISWLFHFNVPS